MNFSLNVWILSVTIGHVGMTEQYPISKATNVNMSQWRKFIREGDDASGMVIVHDKQRNVQRRLCRFSRDQDKIVQVICRHFNYKMGIPKTVCCFLSSQ